MDINAPAFRPYPTASARTGTEGSTKELDEALVRLTGVGDPNLDPLRALSDEQAAHAFDDILGNKARPRATKPNALAALRTPTLKARPSSAQKLTQSLPGGEQEKARLVQTFAPITGAEAEATAEQHEALTRGTEATGDEAQGQAKGQGLGKKLGKLLGHRQKHDRHK